MGQQVERIGFGFTSDNDEALQSKGFGSFGLNQGAKITKLEFNPNGGASDSEADCVDVYIQTKDKEFRGRIYDITGGVYAKDGSWVEDPEDERYNEGYNLKWVQNSAWLTHIVKSVGVTEDQIKKALSTGVATFKEWAEIMCDLAAKGISTKTVDVFLEYQPSLKEGFEITFLQLPPNMKGGYFICPAQKGKFTEKRHEEHGLKYKNEKGAEHPFTRSAYYMESTKAIQQKDGEDDEDGEVDENFEEENTSTNENSGIANTSEGEVADSNGDDW